MENLKNCSSVTEIEDNNIDTSFLLIFLLNVRATGKRPHATYTSYWQTATCYLYESKKSKHKKYLLFIFFILEDGARECKPLSRPSLKNHLK